MSWSPRTPLRTEFVVSAADASGFPRDRLPETALVGRSNVGKSTVINALARTKVARTSAAPGKTRLANFYRVTGHGAPRYLVDLPGYGYARGGGAAAEEFRTLAEAYFSRGASLHGSPREPQGFAPHDKQITALLLVDSRHPGLEADVAAWEWLKALPIPKAVIATKVDKLTRAERTRHAQQLTTVFESPVTLVSAQTGEGLDELWTLIARMPSPTAAAAR